MPVETPKLSTFGTSVLSTVETSGLSTVETGMLSTVETNVLSAVETSVHSAVELRVDVVEGALESNKKLHDIACGEDPDSKRQYVPDS